MLVAVLVLLVCFLSRTHVGWSLAFLVAGVVAGPHAMGLVRHSELVHGLVGAGAVLLFFLAGTRFSIERLGPSWLFLRIVGFQVSLTIAVIFLLLIMFGVAWQASLFTGLLASLGSPALLSKPFSRMEKPAGLVVQAMQRYQSVFVVFVLILMPFLAGVEGAALGCARAFLMLVAFLTLGLIIAHTFMPRWLERAMQERGREGVLVVVLTLCASVLLVAEMVGLGLAITAFLAGFMLSESRHRGRPIFEAASLQLVANALFFVSLGMLLDLHFLAAHWLLISAVAGGVFLIKLIIACGSATSFGIPAGVSVPAVLMLVPVGELAFLLFYAGRAVGLTPAGLGIPGEQAFVAVSVLLVGVSVFARVDPAARRIRRWATLLGPGLLQDACTDQPPVRQATLGLRSRKALRHRSMTSNMTTLTLPSTQCAAHIRFFPILNRLDAHGPCVRVVMVQAGAPACHLTLGQLALWERMGVLVLAVWRGDVYVETPRTSHRLVPGDRVVLSGSPNQLSLGAHLFQYVSPSAPPDAEA